MNLSSSGIMNLDCTLIGIGNNQKPQSKKKVIEALGLDCCYISFLDASKNIYMYSIFDLRLYSKLRTKTQLNKKVFFLR